MSGVWRTKLCVACWELGIRARCHMAQRENVDRALVVVVSDGYAAATAMRSGSDVTSIYRKRKELPNPCCVKTNGYVEMLLPSCHFHFAN